MWHTFIIYYIIVMLVLAVYKLIVVNTSYCRIAIIQVTQLIFISIPYCNKHKEIYPQFGPCRKCSIFVNYFVSLYTNQSRLILAAVYQRFAIVIFVKALSYRLNNTDQNAIERLCVQHRRYPENQAHTNTLSRKYNIHPLQLQT